MKKFFSKHVQQMVLVVAFAVIGAGSAAAVWPITAGFIRNMTQGIGLFGYGYGLSVSGPGYGYGYDMQDRNNHLYTDYAYYGFVGTDGSVTIDSVTVGQTSADIEYSVDYLAKVSGGYSLSSLPGPTNFIGSFNDTQFASGTSLWEIDNLTCGTTYYYTIIAQDAGANTYTYLNSFTTTGCDSTHNSDTPVSSGTYGRPQSFGQPATTNPTTQPTGPAPAFPESPRLEYSDFGPGPQLLQRILNYLGYTVSDFGAGSPGKETQFFGPKTRAALKKFQRAHGLNPDGIYGEVTKAALMSAVNKK